MRVHRETVVFSFEKVLDVTEVWHGDTRVYYGYNYRNYVEGRWLVKRRWDNAHGSPHIDVYDEKGRLKEKILDRERTLVEIKELIKVFAERGAWLDHRD